MFRLSVRNPERNASRHYANGANKLALYGANEPTGRMSQLFTGRTSQTGRTRQRGERASIPREAEIDQPCQRAKKSGTEPSLSTRVEVNPLSPKSEKKISVFFLQWKSFFYRAAIYLRQSQWLRERISLAHRICALIALGQDIIAVSVLRVIGVSFVAENTLFFCTRINLVVVVNRKPPMKPTVQVIRIL